jgi:hypothetical protein
MIKFNVGQVYSGESGNYTISYRVVKRTVKTVTVERTTTGMRSTHKITNLTDCERVKIFSFYLYSTDKDKINHDNTLDRDAIANKKSSRYFNGVYLDPSIEF